MLDDGRGAATRVGASEATPARPEDDREYEAYGADHNQDDPDGVDADASYGRGNRPGQDRTYGDHQETDCSTHEGSFHLRFCTQSSTAFSPETSGDIPSRRAGLPQAAVATGAHPPRRVAQLSGGSPLSRRPLGRLGLTSESLVDMRRTYSNPPETLRRLID